MKKKTNISIVIIAVIIVVAITAIIKVIALQLHKKSEKEVEQEIPVIVSNWNDHNNEYTICTINGRIISFIPGEYHTSFETDMSIEEIVKTNSDDYIGTINLKYINSEYEAEIFYSNNNYYYLYYNGTNYLGGNLSAEWHVGNLTNADIKFPFLEEMTFFNGISEIDAEFNDDSIKELFDRHDFDEMKEFYSRISSEICTIDEDEQCITIKAYGNTNNLTWEKGYKYEIVIDCKNRTITGPTRDGGTFVFKPLS